ncbi:unnamed protein product [Fusarium graminearum]|nr:unnamed protein product [Fusarium graminearum]CAG2005615.1 unnamed protein product [Fusarium graminearum]VTO84709.1 unnamed protein product [Fusarium graminearum]
MVSAATLRPLLCSCPKMLQLQFRLRLLLAYVYLTILYQQCSTVWWWLRYLSFVPPNINRPSVSKIVAPPAYSKRQLDNSQQATPFYGSQHPKPQPASSNLSPHGPQDPRPLDLDKGHTSTAKEQMEIGKTSLCFQSPNSQCYHHYTPSIGRHAKTCIQLQEGLSPSQSSLTSMPA